MQETLEQFLTEAARAWRWRWFGMAVCWLVAVIGASYVLMMPDAYQSEARIRVDADSALRPLMKGLAVNSNIRDQVRLMEQTLLSRPNLAQVARSVDLDVTVNSEAEEQAMLVALKQRIKVRSVGGQLFSVSYHDSNPLRARDVVQSLLTIFVESNLGENREDMEQAEVFLTTQINSYEAQLKMAEEKAARFRAANMGIVSSGDDYVQLSPDSKALISASGGYIKKIENAQRALAITDLDLQEARVIVDDLAGRLAQTPHYISPGDTTSMFNSGGQISSTYTRIQALQRDLDDLLVRYTENHPDVISVRRRIEALVAQYNREKAGDQLPITGGPTVLNPVHEQISLRLVDARSQVSRLERRKASAEEVLGKLQEVASIAPAIEAQMAALNRDYGTIKSQYESLLQRRESARLSRAIESSTDSLQFRTVDPPQIPAEPSGPPRLLYLLMVLGMSFGAGGGAAFVRAQLSDTFSLPINLSEAFPYPVIGAVSLVNDMTDRARGFWQHGTFYAAAGVPVVLTVAAIALIPWASRLRESFGALSAGSLL